MSFGGRGGSLFQWESLFCRQPLILIYLRHSYPLADRINLIFRRHLLYMFSSKGCPGTYKHSYLPVRLNQEIVWLSRPFRLSRVMTGLTPAGLWSHRTHHHIWWRAPYMVVVSSVHIDLFLHSLACQPLCFRHHRRPELRNNTQWHGICIFSGRLS